MMMFNFGQTLNFNYFERREQHVGISTWVVKKWFKSEDLRSIHTYVKKPLQSCGEQTLP
jgi:hypothetical protein